MENNPDLLPDDFDRLIPVSSLKLDRWNVREEEPTDDLVESIRKDGYKKPIIVYPDPPYFCVNDGWQRVGAGVRAGYTQIPCKIYSTALLAMDATQIESLQRPWTKYERLKSYTNYYDACIEEGMSHSEAITLTATQYPGNERRVERFVRINQLPVAVKVLLKTRDKRTPQEWNLLENIYPTIKLKKRLLGFTVADAIFSELQGFSDVKKIKSAIGVLEFDSREAISMIQKIAMYPDADPLDVIEETKLGYGPTEIITVGNIVVNPLVRKKIREYCSMRGIYVSEFVGELIGSWFVEKNEGKAEVFDLLKNANTGIREIKFKIRTREVIISSQFNLLMIIDGSTPIFLTHNDFLRKAWKGNNKVPDYVKTFLNTLKIKL